MANYTGPDPNNLLPGEPWTSQLALASFEDPVAIAEGATGAPKVQSEGLDLFAEQSSGAATYIDLDRVDKVLIIWSTPTGGSYELSTDNGATFGSSISVSANARIISLGSTYNAIKLNSAHAIVGVSGVKP